MTTKLLDILMALGAALAVLLGSFNAFARECDEVPGAVLRLHIQANSDSEYDQAVKLAVRDMVLEKYSARLVGFATRDEAAREVQRLLPGIQKTCCDFLAQQGVDYGAEAELTEMYFTTREYENVTLPAGYYLALRITLGSGEGRNWWCVMFPPLCIPLASEPLPEDSLPEDFTRNRIEIKFAIFEFFKGLFG